MSRSYKKHPYCGDKTNKKLGKKYANRRVRRYKGDIANGKAYIKLYEQWDICDYGWVQSWEEFRYRWQLFSFFETMTEEELYKYWVTHYKRK